MKKCTYCGSCCDKPERCEHCQRCKNCGVEIKPTIEILAPLPSSSKPTITYIPYVPPHMTGTTTALPIPGTIWYSKVGSTFTYSDYNNFAKFSSVTYTNRD